MRNKHTFYWPVVIAVLSIIGLVTALLMDGYAERISLIGLVVPIAIFIYFYWFK